MAKATETILIPLVSKQENDVNFLEAATKNAKEVILLLVVDTKSVGASFGFATSEIAQGRELMEQIKNFLEENKKHVDEIIEWGDLTKKIENIAKLREVSRVVLKSHDAQYLEELKKTLKKKKIRFKVI